MPIREVLPHGFEHSSANCMIRILVVDTLAETDPWEEESWLKREADARNIE